MKTEKLVNRKKGVKKEICVKCVTMEQVKIFSTFGITYQNYNFRNNCNNHTYFKIYHCLLNIVQRDNLFHKHLYMDVCAGFTFEFIQWVTKIQRLQIKLQLAPVLVTIPIYHLFLDLNHLSYL